MGARLLRLSNANVIFFVLTLLSPPVFAQYIPSGNWSSSNISNWQRPSSTLDLDFVNDRYVVNGTSYSGISNLISGVSASFARSSAATYYNASGILQTAAAGVPRLDYDPTTNQGKGLLIEESSTNLAIYSQDFTQAAGYSGSSAVTAATASGTAPDGTNTANLVTASGTGLNFFRVSSIPATTTMTHSIFAKSGSLTKVYFEFHDTTNCGSYCVASFDLTAKTASWSFAATGEGQVSILRLPNGWFRLSATYTYSSSVTQGPAIYIGTYGTLAGNIYLWGAQLETKAFLTSYVATGSSTVTRSADIFSIPVGTWYNASSGTFSAETYGQANSTQNGYGRIVGGDTSQAPLAFDASTGVINSWDGTTVLKSTSFTPVATATSWVRGAMAWDTTSQVRSISGSGLTAVSSTLASNNFSFTNIGIGSSASGYDPINASVRRVTFFPTALSAAVVKDLSR